MTAPASSRRGFTLLEMMITLVIFLMLSVAVFAIMTAVLQGASNLQDNKNHTDQVEALNAFLKKKLAELPARAGLITYRRGDGEGLSQNGIVFGVGDTATAIDAKVQSNGLYTLRLASNTVAAEHISVLQSGGNPIQIDTPLAVVGLPLTNDDPSITWTPLIHDLKTVEWKFEDENADPWVDQWLNTGDKPTVIEFSIQLAGDAQPAVMDFWIPKIEAATLSLTTGAPSGHTGTPAANPAAPAPNAH